MTDYDELCEIAQAIVDAPADQRWALIPDLRAALTARPQPLWAGTVDDLIDRLRDVWLDPEQEVVVYPAGSATPTEGEWVANALVMFDEGTAAKRAAAASPVEPTGDDDA